MCAACWSQALDLSRAPLDCVRPALDRLRSLGPYEGCLREIVHALKYQKRVSVAARLGAAMADAGADLLRDADLVIPVPLHWRRHRARGFNQSELLARQLKLPLARALRRTCNTLPQVDLPAARRHENVRGAFAMTTGVVGFPRHRVEGKICVLVDDVATTGATLEACAEVLKGAGAREVRALTAARAEIARPR